MPAARHGMTASVVPLASHGCRCTGRRQLFISVVQLSMVVVERTGVSRYYGNAAFTLQVLYVMALATLLGAWCLAKELESLIPNPGRKVCAWAASFGSQAWACRLGL